MILINKRKGCVFGVAAENSLECCAWKVDAMNLEIKRHDIVIGLQSSSRDEKGQDDKTGNAEIPDGEFELGRENWASI